jgi:hypothetical protein
VVILCRSVWGFGNRPTRVNGAVNGAKLSKFYGVCAGILLSPSKSDMQMNYVTEEEIVFELCTWEVRVVKIFGDLVNCLARFYLYILFLEFLVGTREVGNCM